MKKQIVFSIIAAGLLGASASAFAGNDRGHAGGWHFDDAHGRNDKYARHGGGDHKAEGRGRRHVVVKENKHDRHQGRHKRQQEKIVIVKKPAHHRHGLHHGVDHGDWRGGKHAGKRFAQVLRVKPIHTVNRRAGYAPWGKCRHGHRSANVFDSVHSLDVVLGGLRIQADRHHDCAAIVKQVDTDYRVTYRYKGKEYVVLMNTHPGNYVRVNRFGELIHG
jgi:hypothetical protein